MLFLSLIQAQIFAVKKNGANEKGEKITLLDVGIRGESKVEMIDGQVYFSAMKFISTTYNNEGQNFHLLIVIYIQEAENEKPKVLTAVISPEIFVDSRRSARDYQENKLNSFVEPFTTDQLDKEFIKRENKSRSELEIEIKNDAEGLYNYLTAPNIRHKVKHPVFLAIRFSNCVSILYNEEKISEIYNSERGEESLSSKEIIEILQKKLLKETQNKSVRQDTPTTIINEKLFLFVIKNVNDSLKRKKVLESIDTLDSQSFGVIEGDTEIPSQFKNFTELGNVSQIYRDNFDLLKELCRRYVPLDEELSNSESSEEFGGSEEPRRIKINKIDNGTTITQLNTSTMTRRSVSSRSPHIICETIHTEDNKISNSQKMHVSQRINDSNHEKRVNNEKSNNSERNYPFVPMNFTNLNNVNNVQNVHNVNNVQNFQNVNNLNNLSTLINFPIKEKNNISEVKKEEIHKEPEINFSQNLSYNKINGNNTNNGNSNSNLNMNINGNLNMNGNFNGNYKNYNSFPLNNTNVNNFNVNCHNSNNNVNNNVNNNLNSISNENKNNGFQNSLNINLGSKKGSAFNNLRNGTNITITTISDGKSNLGNFGSKNQEQSKIETNSPQQPMFGFGAFAANGQFANNNVGIGNISAYGLPNLGQSLGQGANISQIQGLQQMQSLQNMPQIQGINSQIHQLSSMPQMSFPLNNQINSNLGTSALTALISSQGFHLGQETIEQPKPLENLLCSNMLLTNWLSTLKSNNQALSESRSKDDQYIPPPEISTSNDLARLPTHIQTQESMIQLLNQINLYRELVAQVAYQNQILGRNGNPIKNNTSVDELQELMQKSSRKPNFEDNGNLNSERNGHLGDFNHLGNLGNLGNVGNGVFRNCQQTQNLQINSPNQFMHNAEHSFTNIFMNNSKNNDNANVIKNNTNGNNEKKTKEESL